ncbi:MAG TPA: hypothetical protein VH594_11670 [Trebonia sp.]
MTSVTGQLAALAQRRLTAPSTLPMMVGVLRRYNQRLRRVAFRYQRPQQDWRGTPVRQ